MAKLALVASGHDPLRAALAEAIIQRDALTERVVALNAAQTRAEAARWDAVRARNCAQEGIEAAKQAAAAYAVEKVIGNAGEPPPSIEEARGRAAAAKDDVDIALATQSTLAARLDEEKAALRFATHRAEKAALDVLRHAPGVATIIGELETIERQLVDKGLALRWLITHDMISRKPVERGPFQTDPAPVLGPLHRFESPPTTWRGLLSDRTIPGAQPWEAAMAALFIDADAPLPGVG